MKIAKVETFAVSPRWLFVRIETEDGHVGWGESTLEGRARTVGVAVDEWAEYLVGSDPRHIAKHWQVLTKGTFYRGGPVFGSAVAGIDQALWDILGHHLGVPVHTLFGGAVRDRLRVYSWVGGDEPHALADNIHAQREAGFTAVKLNASGSRARLEGLLATKAAVETAQTAREAMGDGDFALDFHGRFSAADARRVIGEVSPLHPLFIEEPILPEYPHKLAEVISSTTVPIACGERLYSRTDFLPVLQAGIAVVQPDISHCGGISEGLKIATLSETFDASFAPHCPVGPIGLAASFHVSAVSPNFIIQEQSVGIHYNVGAEIFDYLVDPAPFDFVDGFAAVPQGAGLGIKVDEAAVRAAADRDRDWHSVVWTGSDGGFAEW